MSFLFNAAEILDMGIEKEKKRRDFYALVAEKFKDKELKKLFENLKSWEEEHIKKFSEIRRSIEEDEPTESYSGELKDYMDVLIADNLYNDVEPGSFPKKVDSAITAINYGLGFEKDAILFFRELLAHVPKSKEAVINKLIDEEKQHLIYLAKLKKQYISP